MIISMVNDKGSDTMDIQEFDLKAKEVCRNTTKVYENKNDLLKQLLGEIEHASVVYVLNKIRSSIKEASNKGYFDTTIVINEYNGFYEIEYIESFQAVAQKFNDNELLNYHEAKFFRERLGKLIKDILVRAGYSVKFYFFEIYEKQIDDYIRVLKFKIDWECRQ